MKIMNKSEYIFSKNGVYIIRTDHSSDRFDDPKRLVNDLDKKLFFNGSIDRVQKIGKKNRVYGFFSRILEIGMICEYREDNKGHVKGNHLIIITWIGYLNESIQKTIESFKMKNKSDEKIYLEYVDLETELGTKIKIIGELNYEI